MKSVVLSIVCLALAFACTKNDATSIPSDNLVGKWEPTYEVYDSTAKKWTSIQTFVALPVIEFASNGNFLKDNKPAGDQDCCGFVGNKYTVKDNKITFSDFKPCPNVGCIALYCDGWKILKLENDVLELSECPGGVMRYKRVKN